MVQISVPESPGLKAQEKKSSSNRMAAGLNGGQTKQNSHHKSQHRTELKHTYNLAVLIRHSIKYTNTVSQKTLYRDTKLQMSSKISKGGKEARLKEGGGGKGGERGGLTDVSCHLQTPRHYGTFPWASRKGRTGTRPYQKPDQKIRVLFQEELISLQSSAQAEALRPDSCVQDRGTRKRGRIGSAKERKDRGEGRGQ